MKFALISIAFITLSILFGSAVLSDPGYVLISLQGLSIEMSLLVFVGAALLSFIVLNIFVQAVKPILSSSQKLQTWHQKRAHQKSFSDTLAGLVALSRGHYDRAFKLLKNTENQPEINLLRQLGAARAAHQLGDTQARDQHLQRLAETAMDQGDAATKQARLLEAEMKTTPDHTQALQYLEKQHKRQPKDAAILHTLAISYEKAEKWHDLKGLLPKLKKHHILPTLTLQQLERTCFHALIRQEIQSLTAIPEHSSRVKKLIAAWKSLPPLLIETPDFHQPHLEQLSQLEEYALAEALLLWLLEKTGHAVWLQLLGKSPITLQNSTLKTLQQHTKTTFQHSVQSAAWYALGCQHTRQKDWKQAEESLCKSLTLDDNEMTHRALADVYLQLKEFEKSAQCFAMVLKENTIA